MCIRDRRFTRPSTEFCTWSKNSASALPSMPGVGMATTRRYTASMPNVNSSRRRSSGMRPAFWNPSSTGHHLGAAARLVDGRLGRRAERVRLDGQRLRQRALPQHLDLLVAADEAVLRQRLAIDHRAGLEDGFELGEVDDAVLDPERIAEAALRQAALERHLATLEARVCVTAGARALPLVTAAGGLAVAGSRTAAEPLA